jgi:hypothetical protein
MASFSFTTFAVRTAVLSVIIVSRVGARSHP